MGRAIRYSRLSTKDQTSGDGPRRQRELALDYCKRRGLHLDEGFSLEDHGMSAYRSKNAKKGKLSLLLEAVRSGRLPKGTVLIIENIDRLTRADLCAGLTLWLDLWLAPVL